MKDTRLSRRPPQYYRSLANLSDVGSVLRPDEEVTGFHHHSALTRWYDLKVQHHQQGQRKERLNPGAKEVSCAQIPFSKCEEYEV
uniref:Uncharacterized protein n=1 Tax=Utricularia reniformis TaxID=192314 RepID=A0A1Y0B1S6_9LAMI|nr:hypothetical protein AEK19_MT1193 [Utricularia reniformis]ART31405.1 hypothetical protein AEK19_MT1193 [Utricularia reniformis]